ncbi:16S rRNA (cytosine(1402)-N(4))-methyltransferase RsmH [Candidatus Palibaumannia cicadellinicola]|uniref:Ribosomal RNA small subunit methyltransferase H n=1 Tax=Candidatus Palibaumannia cicadellinicola TaxID=186490 RepID=A0A0K2BLJ8_9GAMM|nr:16S rRNA (cytosine(1402)-N(4))-methyltransferase RsmH [Candidatus Baumannia cicadellinicola]AKZ66057.1 rRNA small subunit methyltransferase H [Candidatus Baumannia cicadellinicola]
MNVSKIKYQHHPVLLQEAVNALSVKSDGIYIDCTFGRGGHSNLILSKLGKKGRLLAIDRDPEAIAAARMSITDSRFNIVKLPFSTITEYITKLNLLGCIDGILLDLGVSSPQLDDPERGFSFTNNGPLDMRMDNTCGQSATDWLATTSAKDIAYVLKTFGEEKFAKRIGQAIFEKNRKKKITSTRELAELIVKIIPYSNKYKHPATRSFQAIRIYINNEINEINLVLNGALDILAVGGKLVVISFHSIEDRIVKYFIRKNSQLSPLPNGLPLTEKQIKEKFNLNANLKLKSCGKIHPSVKEIRENPRARSALLRFAEKRLI